MPPTLYSLTLALPAGLDDERAGSFASALDDESLMFDHPLPLAGTAGREGRDHRGAWRLQWLFDEEPNLAVLFPIMAMLHGQFALGCPPLTREALVVATMPQTDWLAASYQAFEPFHESGFYIYGSHVEKPRPDGDMPLLIDAATAFGSGEHGTTAGCLNLLAGLKGEGFAPKSVLDLGTGSGILAIAAWRLWGAPVTATDIDPESVRVTRRHCIMNGLPDEAVDCFQSDGFAAAKLQQKNGFDLAIANILAGPLKVLAAPLIASVSAGSFIILSGMLADQADEVFDVYRSMNCTMKGRVRRGDWASLLLQKA